MLDVLRASKGGIITWVFLAAIIVVFVISFGPGSLTRGGGGCGGAASYAARVNGETVPVVEFERMYRPYADAYERDPQTRAMLPYYAAQIMNRLVDDTLLAQEAERRGIVVTADDLNQELWKNPSFQIDGRFNLDKYKAVAGNMFGSVTAYEDMVKRALRVQRLQAAFMTAVQVPESDVHETWKTMSDTYDLSYVLFATADARAEVKVTDADAQAFAAKEGARIEKFYKDNAARYDQPKKVKVRHILAKVEGKDDAAAKKKIEDAIARIQKGEDFAKVATDVSEDVNSKAAGGDLGVITKGQVDEAFAEAALALDAGKISGPVKTPAGWHVIKVEEVIPAKKIPLEAARLDIAKELLSQDRAEGLVKEKAEAALKAAQSGKSLADLYPQPRPAIPASEGQPAKPEVKAALSWGGKPIFARDTGSTPATVLQIPGLEGADAVLVKDALAVQSNTVLPKVYTVPAGSVVAVVKSRARPDEAKYPAERHAHEVALKGEKLRQYEGTWLAQLREKSKVDLNRDLVPQAGQQGSAPIED